MMIIAGVLLFVIHFYLCIVSFRITWYFGTLQAKYAQNIVLNIFFYIVCFASIPIYFILIIIGPFYINEKLGFVFFDHGKTDPLVWYIGVIIGLTSWFGFKKSNT
ncbi:hypothetical protein [Marinomonas posidonica]|uniref:Uncharacterized protein n=1 Tax=Marinomonas posidonica (strain CECT 7376 / NCIMB 14433 / IVIA-Po-181) TaxID=491952 RepID=F6CSU7_MARPP|nr:hypothetical protein [Marinomonas posidonica]AEF53937.1 hypothetical protein Mar181_0884 [Marinomonas posidonica IVIA-Po-181]